MIPSGTTRSGPGDELTDTELAAWRRMLRTTHRLRRELGDELTRCHGLSMADYDALVTLAEAPERGMRMAELAEAILQPRSSLTRLIDSLEHRGLVTRAPTPDDARGARASLTVEGIGVFGRAHRTHLGGIRERFLDRLSDRQLDQLVQVWTAVDPETTGSAPAQQPGRRQPGSARMPTRARLSSKEPP
jgi:DNA-binding MarR family transcriptional regulator